MLSLIGTVILWLILACIAAFVVCLVIGIALAIVIEVKNRLWPPPPRTVLTRAEVAQILEELIAALRSDDEVPAGAWDGWNEFMATDFEDADLALAKLQCEDFDLPPTDDEFEFEPARVSAALEEVLTRLRRATPHRIGFE